MEKKKRKRLNEIQFLIGVLRRGFLVSAARNECLRRASKKVFVRFSLKGAPVFKLHYQCAKCRDWHDKSTALEVDHIEEIGGFKGDWHEFIMRMSFYPDQGDNLQALCSVCHQRKTSGYNARLRYKRK